VFLLCHKNLIKSIHFHRPHTCLQNVIRVKRVILYRCFRPTPYVRAHRLPLKSILWAVKRYYAAIPMQAALRIALRLSRACL